MVILDRIQTQLRCPATKTQLKKSGEYLESVSNPSIQYPIIDGIPILIDDQKSLFCIDDFVNKRNTTFNINAKPNLIKRTFQKFRDKLPSISSNIKGKYNYQKLASLLPAKAIILIIGGSVKGEGIEAIYDNDSFEIIESDVSFGDCTKIICDAHDLPFEDKTFDCVIVQAVLEHVLEPQQCVSEIHRVLKDSGIVYAETPFMQQVHMKQYDFTRFTHLGHRWLFKHFEEINSGPCCGPGMALAWSYSAFLKSFSNSVSINRLLSLFAQITSFFFKYFDYFLIDQAGSYDAASGYYFLGDATAVKKVVNL
ncbi:putative methyltransferase type 11 [Chondrocystis sp. NIES-4102]|nr:putative methyltransferase type 11 [Chondrocystis sp. NIES-4102]